MSPLLPLINDKAKTFAPTCVYGGCYEKCAPRSFTPEIFRRSNFYQSLRLPASEGVFMVNMGEICTILTVPVANTLCCGKQSILAFPVIPQSVRSLRSG